MEKKDKKSLFDKVMDHSMDIVMLGIAGAYVSVLVIPVVSTAINNRRLINNRMDNIKELKGLGANIDIKLKGDI